MIPIHIFLKSRYQMSGIISSSSFLINFIYLLIVLCVEGASLHVHPNRLQFFEYDSISLNCSGFDGPAEWRVIKKLGLNSTRWETSTRTLYIKPAFKSHSGEYWCENQDGERSTMVNVTITGGDTVLEIPAFPIMEGDNVTLACRKKGMPSNLPADFYKDGHYRETGYGGKITMHNVSKSNEGLYKCSFSKSQGKSPESWMAVRAAADIASTPQETIPQDDQANEQESSSSMSTGLSILLPAIFIILAVAGLHYRQKHTAAGSSPAMSATVYENVRVTDLQMSIYDNDTK